MNAKRANNAIWKLTVPDGVKPKGRIEGILKLYAKKAKEDDLSELNPVQLNQPIEGYQLSLYMRSTFSDGLLPFLRGYLQNSSDENLFYVRGFEGCLFIANGTSLYAITSGGGYHIITDFVDYGFPFDTAKKLISNSFTATEARDLIGSRTSRSETYRRAYSISKSEAMDAVWKKLVGKIDANQVPESELFAKVIDPDRPPSVEVKSSFVLRQRLNLLEVTKLIDAIEALPEPSDERRKQLSFLDNVYPIRSNKKLTTDLTRVFVENIRNHLLGGEAPDVDVLDPSEIIDFTSGCEFKLGRVLLGDSTPEFSDLVEGIKKGVGKTLGDENKFLEKFLGLHLTYKKNSDSPKPVRRKLIDFLHGQADFGGQTYFRIDKVWYRILGDFLDNLKRDFIEEVFNAPAPILLGAEVEFLPWVGGKEDEFNLHQADVDGFYFGDKLFAKHSGGKIELFDLLKVDDAAKCLFIIQTKKDFGNSTRDACAQILGASEVIESDLNSGCNVLRSYFRNEWSLAASNKGVKLSTFLKWFTKYQRVYVVLCATGKGFVVEDFERGRLRSHIARREVLATRNEMKRKLLTFKLAHTKYSDS
ncbi:DUF6119 family protein [Amycolatopsis sp. NPDC051903]|uniref:DUF6119 family protein n=1 Tax=Amycolatopsis sp. NPDC051903 TaxID=3363936 RepID=UPI0037A77B01